VRRFLTLHKEFDADDEELTRTRKLRRAFLEERYHDLVEAIYAGSEEVRVGTTVTYEDGRVAQVKAELRVVDVPGGGGY
jgi:long-chain acyl-CoA synthetase